MCCNYGADGKKIIATKGGYDCIMIPGALKASDSALKSPKICGSKMGLITATGTTSATVCCKLNPNYGNTGCRVFKWGVQDFWLRINIPKGKY